MSSRSVASSRRRAPSALGTAEPGARAVLAERDLGAARYVLSLHRQFKNKGAVTFVRRRARGSGGACRARLGRGSLCPLASPPVHKEGRRRLWAPPSQGLGRCLQSSTWGRLAKSSRFAAGSRRMAPGALGIAGPGARAVLAERELGAARHVISLRRQFKKKRAVGLGHRRAKVLGRCLQSAT